MGEQDEGYLNCRSVSWNSRRVNMKTKGRIGEGKL